MKYRLIPTLGGVFCGDYGVYGVHRVLDLHQIDSSFAGGMGCKIVKLQNCKAGDRVRLLCTVLDETTDTHPVNLYYGDLGTVVKTNRDLGVAFDRYGGDIVAVNRKIEGIYTRIVDLCEVVK